MKKFHLQKTKLKPFHLFYIGFFVLYFCALYILLYHINDLQPFQVNVHFFSNVIGSISKRFLSEAAPYALLFYLLYYTKAVWKRIILITLFEILFLINMMGISFYYVTRSNFQFYILEGFNFHILLSFLTPLLTLIVILVLTLMTFLAIALFKIRNHNKKIWLLKKRIFTGLLVLLAFGSPFISVYYSGHNSLAHPDSVEKAFYRTIALENSTLAILTQEIWFHHSDHNRPYQPLTEAEAGQIKRINLDTQLTQTLPNPPKKIVLIVAESLNQNFLSRYNNEIAGSTPYIDQLFEDYPHIDEFYPSGPFTLQGLSAMVCGHTNARMVRQNANYQCAPELMAGAGYQTEFIRGASKYYVGENMHFKKFGYDTIFAREDFEEKFPKFIKDHPDLYNGWGYTDNFVFDEAVERLKQSTPDEKLFLTLLTVDTHSPGGRCYYPKTKNDPEDKLLFSIECLDRYVQEFVENLKKEGLLNEDLIVLLTSDQLYPLYKSVPGNGFQTSFVLEPANIPFLMMTARDLKLEAQQGSHIDIASTLLDLVNIDIPSYYMGKSLASNPYTIPMGQDRLDGYMVLQNEFFPLSLYPKPYKTQDDGPTALQLHVSQASNSEEVEALIDERIKEYEQEQNTNDALFKWYYNKYFNLNGD